MRDLIFTGVHDYNNDKKTDNVRVNMNGAWVQYLDAQGKVTREEQIVFGYSGVPGNSAEVKGKGYVAGTNTSVTLRANSDRTSSAVLHIETQPGSGLIYYESRKF